ESGTAEETEQKAFSSSAPIIFSCLGTVVGTGIFWRFRELPPRTAQRRNSSWPILTHFLSILFAGACVIGGITWIEKANMVLVPTLLLIIVFTYCWSLLRDYSDYGIRFLFTPDIDALKDTRLWGGLRIAECLRHGTLSRTGIVEIIKQSGPASTGLTFIWIPVLFGQFDVFGSILCVLFFLCLSFAGVSSLIANIELTSLTLQDFG
uniref:AA_permease domain-containing protein n=1 Tax=Macrostomum lignano TaxID=282301 RepID=A0A1I8FSI9_9PLAT